MHELHPSPQTPQQDGPTDTSYPWYFTNNLRKELPSRPGYTATHGTGKEKVGTLDGRHVIVSDTPINKGIFTDSSSESIVVDDEKDPEVRRFFYRVINALSDRYPKLYESQARPKSADDLKKIFRVLNVEVKKRIPINGEKLGDIEQQMDDKGIEKVYLSTFFEAGECRHRALLAGYVIERMIKQGKIQGTMSVDVNFSVRRDMAGHAWVRFVSDAGDLFIIDPMHEVVLVNSQWTLNWDYARPEGNTRHQNPRYDAFPKNGDHQGNEASSQQAPERRNVLQRLLHMALRGAREARQ